MMNEIKKKKFRGISYFRYIFGNHWDSNRLTYLPNSNRDANNEHLQICGVLVSV